MSAKLYSVKVPQVFQLPFNRPNYIDRFITPTGAGFMGFNAAKEATFLGLGSGLSLDSNGNIVTAPAVARIAAYSAGTPYVITNTAAALAFGTTSPNVVLTAAGVWRIRALVTLAYAGATVVAETLTYKLRRTNNTPADLANSSETLDLPVSTTLTHTYGKFAIADIYYTTANTDDAISIFANVSATLGAGSINAALAAVTAELVQ